MNISMNNYMPSLSTQLREIELHHENMARQHDEFKMSVHERFSIETLEAILEMKAFENKEIYINNQMVYFKGYKTVICKDNDFDKIIANIKNKLNK